VADGRLKRVKLAFERDFTQIPNDWLRDSQLSLGARGLLAYLMTHRDGFTVTHKSLAATNPEGSTALQRIVDELKRERYLVITKERGNHGRIAGYTWELTDPAEEKRRSTPYLDLPGLGSPDLDNPDTDNARLKEEQSQEHLTQELKTGDGTRAGVNEDASGDSHHVATESPEEQYRRSLHAMCSFLKRRECDWAPSGYCSQCGREKPTLLDAPELVRPVTHV